MEKHPVAKELHIIRVCLVILIITVLFSSGLQLSKTSSNHETVPTIDSEIPDKHNMIQIGENTFAVRNTDPNSGGYNTVKIFQYNPTTNKLTQVTKFNFDNASTYGHQLYKSKLKNRHKTILF